MGSQLGRHEVAEILIDAGAYVNVWDSEWLALPDHSYVPAYLSCRRLLSKPSHRAKIENALVEQSLATFQESIDVIAGIATAGISLGHSVAVARALPLCYVRGESKSYGITGSVEGNPPEGANCLLIDDTLHTGESVVRSKAVLAQEKKIEVAGFLAIASLFPGSTDAFEETIGNRVATLTDYNAICEVAQAAGLLSENQSAQMIAYYDKQEGFKFD